MANENRLIDANAPMIKEHFNPKLIKYSDFVKECNWFIEHPPLIHHAADWKKGIQFAVEIAIRLRPVNAVEVVRCKDCVHRKERVCCNPSAGMWVGVELKDGDFCSYGERRDNG